MARAALKQRGSLHIRFDPETVRLAEPSGKRGRPATVSDAAIQACLTLKALFGLPVRQTTGLVASLPELTGPELASAGLQHVVASPERPERRHRLSPEHRGLASADRQHRDQGRR